MPYFTALVGSPQCGSGFGGPYAIDHILVISAQLSTYPMDHLARNMVKRVSARQKLTNVRGTGNVLVKKSHSGGGARIAARLKTEPSGSTNRLCEHYSQPSTIRW